MKKFENKEKLSLSIAVWLASDEYDYKSDIMHVSATTLLKSTKQIILANRIKNYKKEKSILDDISMRIPSTMGTALHNGIENAWRSNYKNSMRDLGYPQSVIDRIIINPTPEQLVENCIPIYLENRVEKQLGPFTISGKYDIVLDGQLEDYKSTGVYGFMVNNRDEKYRIQGSIYRWLNPDIITNDFMNIQFIFTDWSKLRSTIEAKKGYPATRIMAHPIKLYSMEETKIWLKNKLTDIFTYKDTAEEKLPACNSEELWQKEPTFKYYKNPKKMKRATACFDEFYLANERLIKDNSVGVIKTIYGPVTYCKYCSAFDICSQKDTYLENGTLKM